MTIKNKIIKPRTENVKRIKIKPMPPIKLHRMKSAVRRKKKKRN